MPADHSELANRMNIWMTAQYNKTRTAVTPLTPDMVVEAGVNIQQDPETLASLLTAYQKIRPFDPDEITAIEECPALHTAYQTLERARSAPAPTGVSAQAPAVTG